MCTSGFSSAFGEASRRAALAPKAVPGRNQTRCRPDTSSRTTPGWPSGGKTRSNATFLDVRAKALPCQSAPSRGVKVGKERQLDKAPKSARGHIPLVLQYVLCLALEQACLALKTEPSRNQTKIRSDATTVPIQDTPARCDRGSNVTFFDVRAKVLPCVSARPKWSSWLNGGRLTRHRNLQDGDVGHAV